MDLSIKTWEKDGEIVACCPELDVYTYGETREEAQSRLKRVIVFYAETASQLGYKIDPKELLASLEVQPTWREEGYLN